mmetsp:Transcript_2028/g.4300  ORF Transcript_2028/g.4300 Transcript_2028/m.4300 type:complete len:232 (+) Transcript_2028:232-927(+)|eukprot:CAMPEP_0172590558 /NCGR_PEP_ID=MMETSP1068-20121228/9101_1 /TAXON_ID=35684 /ORGANISM="Pseudopedinella elastica, Strain CCMP716" /LENGTH=231 /DNA_ID=CAMNT_0013386501 /DNA_START=161 /DNA_END=856 /DNA_ORIENTATION=+
MSWKKQSSSSDVGLEQACPHDATSTFFGSFIPQEVKAASSLFHTLPPTEIESLLDSVTNDLKSSLVSDHTTSMVERIPSSDAKEESGAVITALHVILRTAIRTRTKASVVAKDLGLLNLPPTAIQVITEKLKSQRLELEARSLCTRFPHLENLQWRVDVAISSSSLQRVFRPSIMMQMTLSNGRIKTFDVSVEAFHELRYNVAKVLRDMQALERHPIMRIADEATKKTIGE